MGSSKLFSSHNSSAIAGPVNSPIKHAVAEKDLSSYSLSGQLIKVQSVTNPTAYYYVNQSM